MTVTGDRSGVKIIGLSVDSTIDHERWARDIGAAIARQIGIGDGDPLVVTAEHFDHRHEAS